MWHCHISDMCTFLYTKSHYASYMCTNVSLYIYINRSTELKSGEDRKERKKLTQRRVCERLLARHTQSHVWYLSNTNNKMVKFSIRECGVTMTFCVWWFWILCLEKTQPHLSVSIILSCFRRRIRKLKTRRRRKK